MDKSKLIIKSGNKQILCHSGNKICIDLLPNVKIGDKVKLQTIFSDGKIQNSTVECEVLVDIKLGDKLTILKMRRRKRYDRRTGFRQKHTEVLVGGAN